MKTWYTIQYEIAMKKYFSDVTHLKPFYYDPLHFTPLNIAAKDTYTYIVQEVMAHDLCDPMKKLWLVQWFGVYQTESTWEDHVTLEDVEAFHHYCAANKLSAFLPKAHPLYSASNPTKQRRTPAQFDIPNQSER